MFLARMDSIPSTTYRNVNFLFSDKIWLSVSMNGSYLYSLRRLRQGEGAMSLRPICVRETVNVSSLC